MLIVGGREDDPRNVLELREQVEARAAGHLNVKEQEIRAKTIDLRLRLLDCTGFPHDLEPGKLGQQPPHLPAGRWLIIDDEGSHCRAGMQIRVTATPL